LTVRRYAPNISDSTIRPHPSLNIRWPEFPEFTRQNIRNPHLAIGWMCGLNACSANSRSLVGEYATSDGGGAELRISNSGAQSFASVRGLANAWTAPEKMVECTDKDYEDLFGANWRDLEVRGLRASNGSFALFAVRKGASSEGRTFKTGYLLVSLFGKRDMYRL